MLQVIQQEFTTIPQKYLKDILYIIQSGILDIRNDKAILHFDSKGLRVIERAEKTVIPN